MGAGAAGKVTADGCVGGHGARWFCVTSNTPAKNMIEGSRQRPKHRGGGGGSCLDPEPLRVAIHLHKYDFVVGTAILKHHIVVLGYKGSPSLFTADGTSG